MPDKQLFKWKAFVQKCPSAAASVALCRHTVVRGKKLRLVPVPAVRIAIKFERKQAEQLEALLRLGNAFRGYYGQDIEDLLLHLLTAGVHIGRTLERRGWPFEDTHDYEFIEIAK